MKWSLICSKLANSYFHRLLWVTLFSILVTAETSNIPTSNQILLKEDISFPNSSTSDIERLKDHLNILKFVLPLGGDHDKIENLKEEVGSETDFNEYVNRANIEVHYQNISKSNEVRNSSQLIPSRSLVQINSHLPYMPKSSIIASDQSVNIPEESTGVEVTSTLADLTTLSSIITSREESITTTTTSSIVKVTETVTHFVTLTTKEIFSLPVIETTSLISDSYSVSDSVLDTESIIYSSTDIITSSSSEIATSTVAHTAPHETNVSQHDFEKLASLIHDLRNEVIEQKIINQVQSLLISSANNSPKTSYITMDSPTSSLEIKDVSSATESQEVVFTETWSNPNILAISTSLSQISSTPSHVEPVGSQVNINHEGKSGKDLLNSKLPSYKVDITPQFQFHEKKLDKLPPTVPYSKPKNYFAILPVSSGGEESVLSYITSETNTLSNIALQTTSLEESKSTSVLDILNIPQLDDEEMNDYVKRIYSALKKVVEPEYEFKTEFNDTSTPINLKFDRSTIKKETENNSEESDPNVSHNSTGTVLPHNEPYKIFHVPKEMQHEVISSAFKTFATPEEITASYSRLRKTSIESSSPGSSQSHQRTRSKSSIDFNVFEATTKESVGSNFIFSAPSYTAIVILIALSITWI